MARAGIEAVRMSGDTVERIDAAAIDWSVDLAEQGVRFRQVPGPENALGRVKFIFPNHFSVYLTTRPPRPSSSVRAAPTPTGACASRTPWVSRSASCGTTRDGRASASSPPWTRARRPWSGSRTRSPCTSATGPRGCSRTGRSPSPTTHYGLDRRHDAALRRARRRAAPPARRPDRVARR